MQTLSWECFTKEKNAQSRRQLLSHILLPSARSLLFCIRSEISWMRLGMPQIYSASPSPPNVVHSCYTCAKLCHLQQTVIGAFLFAWGEGSLARHITLKGSISMNTSQPAQGECECLCVWVCLCFILRTPNCCSFAVQRQNKHIKAKMCSSLAFTHITALFRISG